MYNLLWRPLEPLVPRRLRLPVSERILADGTIRTPLAQSDVAAAAEIFEAEAIECVAVAFLNAYANPAHELLAERVLREAGFEGEISLSHRASREYREYERTSTTVIDAFIRPRMTEYLRNLEDGLTEAGFRGHSLITRCGGGAMTFAEAETRTFETILSGPVAGAQGGAELARELGIGDVITGDVGGTSFDTALILNGRPQMLHEGRVIGLPIQAPWVDVRSIGAGGGSIAHVDVGGLLRGRTTKRRCRPGPCLLRTGREEPTVTDACVVLGMLGAGHLAGGIRLDVKRATEALAPVADKLGMDVQSAARGVVTIATASMANAIREITIEQGHDPRELALLAFGGAGPLFGTLLASTLGVHTVASFRLTPETSRHGIARLQPHPGYSPDADHETCG